VIVTEDGRQVAVICGHERRFGPFRSGIVRLDWAFSSFVEEGKSVRYRAVCAALHGLLRQRGIRGLQVRWDKSSPDTDAILDATTRDSRFEISLTPAESDCMLRLADAEGVLSQQAGQVRAADLSFFPQIPWRAFRQAAWDLTEKGAVLQAESTARRAIALIAQAERPFLCGVRRPNGSWVSIAGGWFVDNQLIVALQMGDRKAAPELDLAEGLRGLILDDLARAGEVQSILFAGGVSGVLRPLSVLRPTMELAIQKRRFGWRYGHRLTRTFDSELITVSAK
jgi:hypothetical protein